MRGDARAPAPQRQPCARMSPSGWHENGQLKDVQDVIHSALSPQAGIARFQPTRNDAPPHGPVQVVGQVWSELPSGSAAPLQS